MKVNKLSLQEMMLNNLLGQNDGTWIILNRSDQCNLISNVAFSYYNSTLVVQNNASLLLKIILKHSQTLQLFKSNMRQKLFTKVINNAKQGGLG